MSVIRLSSVLIGSLKSSALVLFSSALIACGGSGNSGNNSNHNSSSEADNSSSALSVLTSSASSILAEATSSTTSSVIVIENTSSTESVGNASSTGASSTGNTNSSTNNGTTSSSAADGNTQSSTDNTTNNSSTDNNNTSANSTASTSSEALQCKEMCQWYQDAPRPLCENQTSGWGYENGESCIGRTTCETQTGNGGIINSCTIPSSSGNNSSTSSNTSTISTSSAASESSVTSTSSAASVGSTQFRVDASGNITKDGNIHPIRCGSWFGLEGQHEPKDAANNPDGAPMELYVGNMWWANGGQGTGRTIQQTMDEITAAGINVVRFPIVPQTLNANDPQGIGFAQNGGVLKNHESVRQENARQAMEDFIKLADKNNIDLIIDIHSCSNYLGWRAGRLDSKPPYADADRENYDYTREGYSCSATGNPSSVIQVDAYGESQWLEDLREIASLSEQLGVDNIMAIDIFNEPWDYTWAEWKTLAEKAYAAISAENSDILIMVEGIAGGTGDGTEVPHGSDDTNPNWGENFYPAGDDMLDIPQERLIISPHTYGPSVFVQKQFIDQNQAGCADLEGAEAGDAGCNIVIDSSVLEAGWEEHFGFLRDQGYAMVIGEFGGLMDWPNGGPEYDQARWSHINEAVDEQWQNAFVDYMIDNDIQACYWSINPESADTGGLYQHAHVKGSNESGWGEWLDFDTRKLNLLKRLWGM